MADSTAAAAAACTCLNPFNVAQLCSGACLPKPTTPLAERCFAVVPNTPHDGITFYNMQPLLNNPSLFMEVALRLLGEIIDDPRFPEEKPTHVLALETRGYFLGTFLAYALGVPLVPVRKRVQAARLVRDADADLVSSLAYGTEYAAATEDARLCVQRGALPAGARCLVADDVLATGGSMRAACSVVEACGATVHACVVLLYVADACKWMDVPVVAGFMASPGEPLFEYFNVLPLDTRQQWETLDARRARELD